MVISAAAAALYCISCIREVNQDPTLETFSWHCSQDFPLSVFVSAPAPAAHSSRLSGHMNWPKCKHSYTALPETPWAISCLGMTALNLVTFCHTSFTQVPSPIRSIRPSWVNVLTSTTPNSITTACIHQTVTGSVGYTAPCSYRDAWNNPAALAVTTARTCTVPRQTVPCPQWPPHAQTSSDCLCPVTSSNRLCPQWPSVPRPSVTAYAHSDCSCPDQQ